MQGSCPEAVMQGIVYQTEAKQFYSNEKGEQIDEI